MSRPDHREPFNVSIWFGQGVVWGGHSMFSFSLILYFYVLAGMVLNQRQLSIVVSDSEPYLVAFSHLFFVGSYFLFCVCTRQNCFVLFHLLFCSSVQC